MRRSLDVLRSAKLYVSMVLPGYEVRLSSEEGTWERPFARVAWSTPMSLMAVGAYHAEMRRTLSVVAWPVESASADLARLAAEDLVEQLTVGFAIGVYAPAFHEVRAHPLRIPIWDYSGVAVNAAVNQTTARATGDFAAIVEPPSIGDIDDPNTELGRLVTCDLRLSWMRSTALSVTHPVTTEIDIVEENMT